MSRSSVETHSHAIVIGGGVAGLLASRVLAKHFDKVTLIERDYYPQEPASRPGVPQSRQVHTMLLHGQRLLKFWFPGFSKKLLANGATEQWYGHKSIYVYGKRRSVQIPLFYEDGIVHVCCSNGRYGKKLSTWMTLLANSTTNRHDVRPLLACTKQGVRRDA